MNLKFIFIMNIKYMISVLVSRDIHKHLIKPKNLSDSKYNWSVYIKSFFNWF